MGEPLPPLLLVSPGDHIYIRYYEINGSLWEVHT